LDKTIVGLTGQVFKELKESYTGGSVNMYIPMIEENELIYTYDVNSLYQSVILNNPMPIGNPTYFNRK
jgi:hypothetical protein